MGRILVLCCCVLLSRAVWAIEPRIDQVQAAALQYAGLDRMQVANWQSRASWKAALPQLRFSVQRDIDEQLRITNKDNVSISGGNVTIGPDEQDILRDFDAGMRFQVTAVWYLDRLVFDRDEILVSQERRRRNDETFALLEHVIEAYYERQAALEHLDRRRLSAADRIQIHTIVKDRTARLDAYTGGWFSAALQGGS